MRFHLGGIPGSPDFAPDAPWKPLREPTPWLFQVIAIPLGVITAVLVAILWFAVTPLRATAPKVELSTFLLTFIGLVIVHELIHAAIHPMAGRSSHSILGFWPSRILFYAHYDGQLTRNRFLAILLMPLLVISIGPLLFAGAMQVCSGWVAFVSCLNTLSACGDVLGAGMVLFQIPAKAIVRNQGWKTYWKEDEAVAV